MKRKNEVAALFSDKAPGRNYAQQIRRKRGAFSPSSGCVISASAPMSSEDQHSHTTMRARNSQTLDRDIRPTEL